MHQVAEMMPDQVLQLPGKLWRDDIEQRQILSCSRVPITGRLFMARKLKSRRVMPLTLSRASSKATVCCIGRRAVCLLESKSCKSIAWSNTSVEPCCRAAKCKKRPSAGPGRVAHRVLIEVCNMPHVTHVLL